MWQCYSIKKLSKEMKLPSELIQEFIDKGIFQPDIHYNFCEDGTIRFNPVVAEPLIAISNEWRQKHRKMIRKSKHR